MKKINLLLMILSMVVWISLFFLLNISFTSLTKVSDKSLLNVDGYFGENIVYDSKTASYWWIFSDRMDNNIKLARSPDLINWDIGNVVVNNADSACLRRFGGIWYIFYGSENKIWMIKSGVIDSDYSSSVLVLECGKNIEDWDGINVSDPDIIWNDGLYYLFYTGVSMNNTYRIGYALSNSPGGKYVKYAENPILSGSSFWDFSWNSGKNKASHPCVEKIGDNFVIQHTACFISNRSWNIGLAISKDLHIFQVSKSPMITGKNSDWSSEGVMRGGLVKINDKWYTSYAGYKVGDIYGRSGISIIDLGSLLNNLELFR
jgi:predicted GH43/DUF377 family glycosyl hydrolase